MKSVWRHLMLIATLVGSGCEGDALDYTPGTPLPTDKFAGCTDPAKCCTTDEKPDCVGDPDTKMVCTCRGLWDCDQNPRKCTQPLPVPPGGGDWQCKWEEFKYTCTKTVPPGTDKGPNPETLMPGGSAWACKFNETEFKWVCEANTPPNPTNTPEGTSVWKCTVQNGALVCERTDAVAPPQGSGTWKCETINGKYICTKTDSYGGLPPGGSDWKCNKVTQNGVPTWVCYGQSTTPPGGNSGWVCTKADEFGTWKCVKAEDSSDLPPGGGWYACVKGSEFGGTKCEQVPTEPLPPTPEPRVGDKCIIGDKMWCDGLLYCGWGQVICDPATNKWKTIKNSAGQEVLDCKELDSGARPNTACACYHFFFNPACCERPDCIVPPGTNGQICKPSAGKLCDYCNPQKSECQNPTVNKCIVTNSHETFCGQFCGAGAQPCPQNYTCMTVKLAGSLTTQQCVPADYSCYY